jgi:lysophospholipase L1-like esterase
MNSGAFWSCAEWGAKNDDFLMGGNQIEQCFPEETRNQRTLVIMTMGGNDIKDFSQDLAGGTPLADVWTAAEEMVANKRAAIEWLTDPGRFPNGNMVVFANVYEFTDMTGDFLSCQLAASAGFELTLEDPTDMLLIVGWIEEQYAKIAADTGTDFIFMFEHFCGHGFESTNPESPCYRGPDNETWFDLTCIHPNQTGHGQISRMFLDVIDE